MDGQTTTDRLAERRARLLRLQTERCEALWAGVPVDCEYLRRLSAATEDARRDYAISAVSEIASLRRALADGRAGCDGDGRCGGAGLPA